MIYMPKRVKCRLLFYLQYEWNKVDAVIGLFVVLLVKRFEIIWNRIGLIEYFSRCYRSDIDGSNRRSMSKTSRYTDRISTIVFFPESDEVGGEFGLLHGSLYHMLDMDDLPRDPAVYEDLQYRIELTCLLSLSVYFLVD